MKQNRPSGNGGGTVAILAKTGAAVTLTAVAEHAAIAAVSADVDDPAVFAGQGRLASLNS